MLIVGYHHVVPDFEQTSRRVIPALVTSTRTFERQLATLATSHRFADLGEALGVLNGSVSADRDLCVRPVPVGGPGGDVLIGRCMEMVTPATTSFDLPCGRPGMASWGGAETLPGSFEGLDGACGSCVTSSAGLSSRRPLNDACRMEPVSV